ncbi:hypothetical protein K0U83_08195 [bacterium]|nr:hypothetical protein [bacterium]
MNDVVDTRTKNGWTATIYYDQGCENPRDDDSHFLFLGLKHRRYEIGDETIDHDMDCPNGCDGGFLYNEATDATDIVCDLCSGEGRAISLDMLEAFIQYKYKPLHMRRVGMGDHSRVWYYLGGGAAACDPGGWDSGTAGFMLYLPEHKEAWGGDPTTDELNAQMTAELREYTDWCNGNCYGYIITDINGDEVDSCWGLIGDYGEEETMRVLDVYAHTMKQPETLHDVRLTDRQIHLLLWGMEWLRLRDGHEVTYTAQDAEVRDTTIAILKGAMP